MEKINLSVERSFSDLITATINLVKQEFVPFIRAFAIIGFPVVLLMVFLIKDLLLRCHIIRKNTGRILLWRLRVIQF